MDYRYLGRSALQVSPLCLGAMMFGGETSTISLPTSTDALAKYGDGSISAASSEALSALVL